MIQADVVRRRFMKDSKTRRLGAVASDLARLSALAKSYPVTKPVFQDVLAELKFFTEWTAADLNFKKQRTLLALQRILAGFSKESLSPSEAVRLSREAKKWSGRILAVSGLI